MLAQQDESKKFVQKRISYHYSFEKYTHNYLPSFSLEEIDKLDILSHENAKYLLYKFNDWIESMGAEQTLIRRTSEVKDKIGLQKIEEKEAIFNRKNYSRNRKKEPLHYRNRKKSLKSCLKLRKITRFVDAFINHYF